jgi:hypothetical protein
MLSFLCFVAFAFTASSQITINGVADRQHYNDAVTFTIVTQPGFSYAATLNGRPVAAGVAVVVNRPDFYELAVTRTDNGNGDVTLRWVRFLVNSSERGDTEWGLPPHIPAPFVQGAAEEFDGARLDLIAPAVFPAGYPVPVVAWVRRNGTEIVRANGLVQAPGHPSFQVQRGVGSGFLAATNPPGLLNYEASLHAAHGTRTIQIDQTTVWTDVSSLPAGVTTWPEDSRVTIPRGFRVLAGSSLEIGAGSIVRLAPGVTLTNEGTIRINGKVERPVVFMPQLPGQPWGGFVQHADNTLLEGHGVIFTGCGGTDPCWFTGHGCSSSSSGIGSHRGEQGLYSLRGNNCNVTLEDSAAIAMTGQLGHSVGGSPLRYRISLDRFLMQGATTGGEYTSASFSVRDSAFINCPEPSPEFEDGDNDGLYLVGGVHGFTNTLFGWTKDDGIDSGGTDSASSGFARIHFEACWFEGTFHEGNSLSGFKDVSSFQTVYLNCGQGIEDGYNAPTGRVVRGLFLNCQSGARHGDNYEDIGNYDGRLTVTDSILLDNHRDLLGYNWRVNGWTNAWGQFFATNNLLTALDTNFPNNQVFQPASDAWRLSAFQAAGRVGAAMTLWPGHAALTNLPDGVPVGLSRFSSNVVTVNYRVDGTDVAAVSDTLVFTPGLVQRFIPLPAGFQGVVRVSLEGGQNVELTGLRAVYLQSAPASGATLVSMGAIWRYLDTGVNLSNAWRAVAYNDSAWPSGPAELGFGESDQATLIASNRQVTTYFRHHFVVATPSSFGTLSMRMKRDDAGVVYLNGSEVYRSPNLPLGAISYTNLATTSVENVIDTATFSAANLRTGENVLAVEIHQQSITSSDVSFDFELIGVPPAAPARVEIGRAGPGTVVYWADPSFRLETSTSFPGGGWTPVGSPSPVPVEPSDPTRLYRLSK